MTRLAHISVDGPRTLVRALIHDGERHWTIRRGETIFLGPPGDASLGQAILAALSWGGPLEPFDGPADGWIVEWTPEAYRIYALPEREALQVRPGAPDLVLGAAVARVLGIGWGGSGS